MRRVGVIQLSRVLCVILIAMAAGCAALSSLNAKPETLEQRVKNYMQAQVEKKWDVAYSFFDSSTREQLSREEYVYRTRKISYKGFTVEEITILPSGDQATVKVRIDISFRGFVFPPAPQTQTWVKEKGNWFTKQLRKKKTPFSAPEKQK